MVVRRRFGPVVPIHGREDRKWPRRAEPAGPLAPVAPVPDVPPDEPVPPEDPGRPTAEGAFGTDTGTCGREGVGAVTVVTVGTGAGVGGSCGTVGSGSGGTVTVGSGGRGTGSPAAVPATSPATARTAIAANVRIHLELRNGQVGCGSGVWATIRSVTVLKRDYYEVLGVPRDADDETIRRAFHALARDWHPDVADAPEAEGRFRELAEAYSVLSKREARALYDRYGYRGRGNQLIDDVLWDSDGREPDRGSDIHTELELRSYEAEEGTRRVISFTAEVRCPACRGRGALGLPDPECEFCEGTGRKRTISRDTAQVVQVEACPACVGEPCPRCEGTGTVPGERRLRLRIPPGLGDGAQLRVRGDGNDARVGAVPGDLLVRVRVLPVPRDPRAVRYLAFILLVVAIATLVLYVIR